LNEGSSAQSLAVDQRKPVLIARARESKPEAIALGIRWMAPERSCGQRDS